MAEPLQEPAPAIDVFALARDHGHVEGRIELARLTRLAPMLASTGGAIGWRLSGEIDARGRPAATIVLRGKLAVRCHRCSLDVDLPIEFASTFWFVRTEEELNAQPIEVDAPEPLLGSRHFPLAQLIEDELILALPISPRHPHCLAVENPETAADRHRPLAALAALKSRH